MSSPFVILRKNPLTDHCITAAYPLTRFSSLYGGGSLPYGNAPKKSRPFAETAGWVILPYGNTPKKVVRSPKKTTK